MNETRTQEISVAPVVVVAPARCKVGAGLIKAWVNRYNAIAKQRNDKWQVVLWDWKKYIKHTETCEACRGYELARRARYK